MSDREHDLDREQDERRYDDDRLEDRLDRDEDRLEDRPDRAPEDGQNDEVWSYGRRIARSRKMIAISVLQLVNRACDITLQ